MSSRTPTPIKEPLKLYMGIAFYLEIYDAGVYNVIKGTEL